MENEIWKIHDKTGFKVSSNGNVLVFRNGIWKKREAKICTRGYLKVFVSLHASPINYLIHRLVAECFIINPENKPQVNHINLIKTDNRVENLEWCNGSENIRHVWDNGRARHIGENNPLSKLTEDDVRFIKNSEIKVSELRKMFGLSVSYVYGIKKGHTWKHIT